VTIDQFVLLAVHKSGGTTACKLAQLSNEVVPAGHNCNSPDGTFDLRKSPDISCEKLIEYVRRTGATFVANERHLPKVDANDDFSCGGFFFTAIIVRHPINRIRSTMAVEPQLDVLTALGYGTGRPTTWRHQGKQPLHSHEFFDNYLIRFLLGPNVWAGPLSFINETHADLALNVLKKFDFVGTLEHNGVDKLAACVGWNTSQPAPQFNRFQRATKRPLDGALQHALTQHNRLDTELWQWIAERDQQCPIEWTKLEAQEEELINDKVWALKDAGNGAWSSTNNLLPNMQISVDMDDRYTFLVGQMTLLHEKMNKVLGEIQHLKSERILTASAVTNSPTKTAIKRPVIPRALIPQATTKARSPADLKRENDTFRSMLVSMEKLQFDTQHRLILNLSLALSASGVLKTKLMGGKSKRFPFEALCTRVRAGYDKVSTHDSPSAFATLVSSCV